MLKPGCIYPGTMNALSLCGHGDKILIVDGNYPLDVKSEGAAKVYLGLAGEIPTVTDILRTFPDCISVEKAEVTLSDGEEPEILGESRTFFNGMELDGTDRLEFYDVCEQPCVRLVIPTGKKRTLANILITVGVA